jgi:hypothetical protein
MAADAGDATTPSSTGCLSDSRTERGNLGNSSMSRIPWCAKVLYLDSTLVTRTIAISIAHPDHEGSES